MEHLKQETTSGAQLNLDALYQICPQCFTESKDPKTGKIKHTVDFEKLRLLLGDNVAEGDERYDFTWVGKRAALQEAAKPIRKTLRPCPQESVDWENTKNLYIEGDNLEVLKLLQNSYMGKVKMIYIDPPYNTGNDFIYQDDFHQTKKDFDLFSGDVTEEGDRLIKNTESNGRYHSDWCSMIYSRLVIARSFLTDDGVIFISIDDNEVENLRKMCDEIFGVSNFIAQIIIEGTPKNDPYVVSTAHEYCLVFCKNFEIVKEANYGVSNPLYKELIQLYDTYKQDYKVVEEKLNIFYTEKGLKSDNIANYKYADAKGIFRIGPIDDPQNSGPKDTRFNPKTGRKVATPSSGWSCNLSTWEQWIREDLILFPEDETTLPAKKTYVTEDRLDVLRAFHKMQTRKDTDYLKRLFCLPYTPFQNPKPVEIIKQFIENCNDKKMIVMDFFSGSATTAQACVELNLKDEGERRFIIIQLPEQIKITSGQSNKAKKITQAAIDYCNKHNLPCTICEIGKERIRLAGKNIKEETGLMAHSLDVGFRVFKCADSNMKDVYYTPADYNQQMLLDLEDNIKEDRNDLDLLFGCMLDWGVTLDLPLRTEKVDGVTIHIVNKGDLVACFDQSIPETAIDRIASLLPMRVVLRDNCFKEAKEKMNFFEIFKQRTGWSEDEVRKNVKVI